jgi:hypothetical protein
MLKYIDFLNEQGTGSGIRDQRLEGFTVNSIGGDVIDTGFERLRFAIENECASELSRQRNVGGQAGTVTVILDMDVAHGMRERG